MGLKMFKVLGSYDVFKPGSDLWALLGCHESFLFKKINWSLKFLLCHSDKKPKAYLLVSTGGQFACKNILYLESQDISLCHKFWTELKKPSLRLFLFDKKIDDLQSQWPKEDLSHKLTCVTLSSYWSQL